MTCKDSYRRLSFQSQLLCGLLPILVLVFAVAIGVFVGVGTLTKDKIVDDSTDAVVEDVSHKIATVLLEKTQTLRALLNQNVEGFLLPVGNAIVYATKLEGYSLYPEPIYPDNLVTDLKPPVTMFPRSGGQQMSLESSSYFIPGFSPSGDNIANLTQEYGSILNQTSHIDFWCKCLFENFTNVAAVYFGHADTGTFIRYPGASSIMNDPTRSYDPRDRPWYQTAIEAEGDISVSDPYLDHSGLGWMITISYRVRDFEGTVIGVVGIDILIETIQENVLNFQFEGSHSHLIQKNDIVLSSPEWTPTKTDGQLFMVTDISNPPLPKSKWEGMKSEASGQFWQDEYLVVYQRINIGGQTYYYITFVPEDNIKRVVNENKSSFEDKISALNTMTVLILLIGMIFMMVVASLIIVCCITRPLKKSSDLMMQVGEAKASGDGLSSLSDALQENMQNTQNTRWFGQNEAQGLRHQTANAFSQQAQRESAPPPEMKIGRDGLPSYDAIIGQYPNTQVKYSDGSIAAAPIMRASAPPPPVQQGMYPPQQPPVQHPLQPQQQWVDPHQPPAQHPLQLQQPWEDPYKAMQQPQCQVRGVNTNTTNV